MAGYEAGQLRGMRMRDSDNERTAATAENQRRYDTQTAERSRIQSLNERRNQMLDARSAEQDRIRGIQSDQNQDIYNRKVAAYDRGIQTQKSQESTGILPNDIVDDISENIINNKMPSRRFNGVRALPDGGREYTDLQGNPHVFNPQELNFIKAQYVNKNNIKLKRDQSLSDLKENRKYTESLADKKYKRDEDLAGIRAGQKKSNIKGTAGYYIKEMENRGLNTSKLYGENRMLNKNADIVVETIQYYKNKGLSDDEAIDKASKHINLLTPEDELKQVNEELKQRESESIGFNTDRYNELVEKRDKLTKLTKKTPIRVSRLKKTREAERKAKVENKIISDAESWLNKNPNHPSAERVRKQVKILKSKNQ